MPSKSAIQNMNKLLGVGNIKRFGTKFNKDSDRDGVPDILDCQPHNPRRQGIIHDVKQRIGAKIESAKKERAERAEAAYKRTTKADEAAEEERMKQAMETARYKEKLRGEKARASAKSGGFLGAVSRFATAPPKRASPRPRRRVAVAKPRAVRRKKPKMIKRKIKRRATRTRAAQPLYFDVSKFKY